jgi:Xaa-Pro dipeptidase
MSGFNLRTIQKTLIEKKIDGWFFYDFQGCDPIGRTMLEIPHVPPQTRRWYYFIPKEGAPIKIVHSIERNTLDHLPGKKQVYLGWQELTQKLQAMLGKNKTIAAQYSPDNNIPNISRVDAGTFELLQKLKLKIVSSAELVQLFESRLSEAQLNTHLNTAKHLYEIIQKSFRLIRRRISGHKEITELDLQLSIMQEMNKRGLVFDHRPMVATGKNTGNPHYTPTEKNCSPILPGDLVLLNLWAKEKSINAVYAVLTWMGFVGKEVPRKFQTLFSLICRARDETVEYIKTAMNDKKPLMGFQVDDFARNILREAGYESYFLHRTGHSIGRQINANGVNMDNLETHDERPLIQDTCFSIEPALYFSDFGLRSEINVFSGESGIQVTTQPAQTEIVAIMK